MATSKIRHVKTLILGGGISGLSTAYALEQRGQTDYLLAEATARLGGLCATTFSNGYHFDCGGHVLHVHTPTGHKLVKKLLAGNLSLHHRDAWIYTHAMRVPFPFQLNLWALPAELRELCVECLNDRPAATQPPEHFEQWCVQNFGYGLYEAFFRPYNQKLWGRPLSQLSYEWCGPFVPAPAQRRMIESAYQKPLTPQGYNASFYYPKQGGCGALTQALAKHVQHVQLNAALTRLDLKRKTAYLNDTPVRFEQVVNTLPLPRLVEMLDGHIRLKQWARLLQAQPVTVYHLAIARRVKPFSWIYFPDDYIPFYRVGLTSALCANSIPHPDTSLFCIELPGRPPTNEETEKQIWDGLYQKGLITQDDGKLFSAWQVIDPAYVIFNSDRARVLPGLLCALEKENCFCIGRYGRWEYSFMETSLLQGWELAQRLM